jgi:hypothetical protein
MAEMRRPMDFWKGMVPSSNFIRFDCDLRIMIGSCANPDLCRLSPLWSIRICKPWLPFFIGRLYISTQAFQGQFTLPLAFQGVSVFAWQTLGELLKPLTQLKTLANLLIGNVLSLITGIIAAGLYGNIGISKVFICYPK